MVGTELVIETERLVLRPFVEADVPALSAIFGDPEVVRHLGWGAVPTRAEVWRQVASYMGHVQMRGYGMLAVVDRADGRLIGRSGPWYPEGWPGVEVGWVIGRDRWGEGFATEAGGASLRWCWDHLDIDEAVSIIRPRNAASIRVAVKLGARLDRVDPDFMGAPAEIYVHRRPDAPGRGSARLSPPGSPPGGP